MSCPVIIADYRENRSGVIKRLENLGVEVKLKNLPCGDYIVSDSMAFERKSRQDFIQSYNDGHLLNQLLLLRKTFEKPFLLIEAADIKTERQLHFHLDLVTNLMLFYKDHFIPTIETKNIYETADILASLAKENTQAKNFPQVRNPPMKAYVINVLCALPFMTPSIAEKLIRKFGSLRNIINNVDSWKDVESVPNELLQWVKESKIFTQ